MEASEKEFEDKIYNYLLENKKKAFTIVALRTRLVEILFDSQKKEYGKNNLQKVLNQMKINGKIRTTQHEGKLYYFISEIFKSSQGDGETYYMASEIFISAKTTEKKFKKKYCKRCNKEVIAQLRSQKGHDSVLYPTLASFTQKSIEARANSGWFCPDCGEKLKVYKKAEILGYLSCLSLIIVLTAAGLFAGVEVQFSLYLLALIFSFVLISLMVRQLVMWILRKRGKKIIQKMKELPRESLKLK